MCKDLIVATDHKPLLNVLNDRSLSDIQNRRLENLKEKTLSYILTLFTCLGRNTWAQTQLQGTLLATQAD